MWANVDRWLIPPSTMVPPEAAAPPTTTQSMCTTPSNAPGHPVSKSLVKLDCDLMICAFFPTPTVPNKFNPITAMKQLFRVMIKDEPSLVIHNATNEKQIKLASESIPNGETEFKKFFKVSTTQIDQQKKTHVCIGCHVFSNRILSAIKFQSPGHHLLDWLKKERVFVESDSLGIDRPITIGHFIKITPEITHLTNFWEHLVSQLMLLDVDADTAIGLAPHLKEAQLEAMPNGNEYIPILPPFKLYQMKITHGRELNQVSTDVIGVKGKPNDAKLLSEFFTRLVSETCNDHRDSIFLPKGAVHQLGLQTYEQILQENDFFLMQVATIPINLEHKAWFAVIDPQTTDNNEPISLHKHLLWQMWFQHIESAGCNKCLLVTTHPNLPAARKWINENLVKLIRHSIPPDIDPPESQLPRHLDKPVYTTTSTTYADILKKQFSLSSNASMHNTTNNQPPCKRPAKVIDYDLDKSEDTHSSTPTAQQSTPNTCNSTITTTNPATLHHPPAPTAHNDYAKELLAIKSEINDLKTMLTIAVEQFKTAIVSLNATPRSLPPNAMDTEIKELTKHHHPTPTSPDLATIVNDLKHELATFVSETRALLQQQNRVFIPFKPTPMPTWIPLNQCGSS